MANKNRRPSNVWVALYMTVAKLIDSGLGIFVIIAAVIVALAWVLTSGLSSADRLIFLQHIADNRILAWGGWVIAVIVILVTRWLLKKERTWYERELKRVDDVKEKALQANLDLPETKSKQD